MSEAAPVKTTWRARLRPVHVAPALALLAAAALPLLFTSRYSTNLLILGAAWSIATLGLVVVLGYAGQISLARPPSSASAPTPSPWAPPAGR